MRMSSIPQWKPSLNGALPLESEGCECSESDLSSQPPYDVSPLVPLPTARRLAKYQEADSEEEEMVPRGGSLPQRGSIGSHQSVRIMHRIQSTKTHRRTGSRAEAKRASMLSKHTAFSSPMVSPPFLPTSICRIHRKCLCLVIQTSYCWRLTLLS